MGCGSINVWVDIIIPILSAVLGGAVTMIGVLLTIHRDKKREEENYKKSVKPWIYSMDSAENFDPKTANDIIMAVSPDKKLSGGLSFVIKNTDNGVGIIDKFVTENKTYIPIIGRILDKNSITYLHVYFEEDETIRDMYLYVKDVLGNEYKFKAYQHDDKRKSNYIEEVIEN